jgi:hypothetical protein
MAFEPNPVEVGELDLLVVDVHHLGIRKLPCHHSLLIVDFGLAEQVVLEEFPFHHFEVLRREYDTLAMFHVVDFEPHVSVPEIVH